MKNNLSMCHHLVGSFSEESIRNLFPKFFDLGLSAVELLGEPDLYDATARDAIRTSDLEVSGLTAASRVSTGRDLVSADHAARAAAREHLLRCAEFALDIDTKVVGVALTAVGRFQRDRDYRLELDRIREAVDWLQAMGDKYDLFFSVEMLNRFTSAYFNSPRDVEMLGDSCRVTVALDSFHLLTELRELDDLAILSGRVSSIQVSGGGRGPMSKSLYSAANIVNKLVQFGFEGPIVFEGFPVNVRPFEDATYLPPSIIDHIRTFVSWASTEIDAMSFDDK